MVYLVWMLAGAAALRAEVTTQLEVLPDGAEENSVAQPPRRKKKALPQGYPQLPGSFIVDVAPFPEPLRKGDEAADCAERYPHTFFSPEAMFQHLVRCQKTAYTLQSMEGMSAAVQGVRDRLQLPEPEFYAKAKEMQAFAVQQEKLTGLHSEDTPWRNAMAQRVWRVARDLKEVVQVATKARAREESGKVGFGKRLDTARFANAVDAAPFPEPLRAGDEAADCAERYPHTFFAPKAMFQHLVRCQKTAAALQSSERVSAVILAVKGRMHVPETEFHSTVREMQAFADQQEKLTDSRLGQPPVVKTIAHRVLTVARDLKEESQVVAKAEARALIGKEVYLKRLDRARGAAVKQRAAAVAAAESAYIKAQGGERTISVVM